MVIFLKIGRLGFFSLSWIGFFVIYIWLIDWLIVIIFFFFFKVYKNWNWIKSYERVRRVIILYFIKRNIVLVIKLVIDMNGRNICIDR